MSSEAQSSFSKGELNPDAQGRVDVAWYKLALRKLRNWLVSRFGGVRTRPGSQYVGRVKTSANGKIKLIPFTFSQSLAFMLEFGNLYVRFIKNGAQVLEASVAITGVSNGATCTVTAANSYANGDEVVLSGIGGVNNLNGRNVLVASVTGANFVIQDLDGNNIDTTSFGAYTSGGTAARVYQLTTPYVTADLQTLNYVQSANVLTIAHNNYPPADVSRVSDNSWTYTAITFQPGITGPTGGAIATPSGIAGTSTYQLTALSTTEESLIGTLSSQAVTVFAQVKATSVTLTVPAHGYSTGDILFVTQTDNSQNVTNLSCAAAGQPLVLTVTAHGYSNGDEVYLTAIRVSGIPAVAAGNYPVSNVAANTFQIGVNGLIGFNFVATGKSSQPFLSPYANQNWSITKVDANNFTLNGANPALSATVAALVGGTVATGGITAALSGPPTTTAPNIITWNAVVNAVQYNVYKVVNGLAQWIGSTSGLTFSDTGYTPQPANNPPISMGVFGSPNNYPAVVCYFNQGLTFANTINAVAQFWKSKPGARTNFTYHVPPQAGDAVTSTLVGNNEVNPILGMMDLRKLALFTSSGEYQVSGPNGGAIVGNQPLEIRQSSVYGSGTTRPILVNAEAAYVQAQGGMLRTLSYNWAKDNYEGSELSIASAHLMEGNTVSDMAYQKAPNSIIWIVRSDGLLLALTYVSEQQVTAMSQNDFVGQTTPTAGTFPIVSALGTVENVACIPEGKETALYFVVNRSLYGSNLRYIERLSTRLIGDIRYYNAMDAALTFDGTGPATTSMQFSSGVNYTYDEHITLTASVATFTAANVGDAYFVYTVPVVPLQPVTQVRFVVDTFLSTTTVQGHVQGGPVPASLVSGTSTNWARAVKTVSGLWHLKGQSVSVFGDGFVVANPFNTQYKTVYTVDANGNLGPLDRWYSIITVGLPVTCDIQTLDIMAASPNENINQRMIVTSVSILSRLARGLWAGADFPPVDAYGSGDTSQTGLEHKKVRDQEGYDSPPNLAQTDRTTIPIQGTFSNTGRVVIRVTDPVPATILGISVNGLLQTTQPPKQQQG